MTLSLSVAMCIKIIREYIHFVGSEQIFMKKGISNQWGENNLNILFLKTIQMSLTTFSL